VTAGILHCTVVEPGTIRTLIKGTLKAGKPVLLTHRAWRTRVAESGRRPERALQFLCKVGGEYNRPVLLNLQNEDGTSQTIALARGWSQERLAGFVGAMHEELAEEFGEISRMYSLDRDAS
jgi:hypothetical protein